MTGYVGTLDEVSIWERVQATAGVRSSSSTRVRIHLSQTTAEETPLPAEVASGVLLGDATGRTVIMGPAEEVVRSAGSLVRSLACLPIDPEADKIIDDLMAKRQKSLTMTRLR